MLITGAALVLRACHTLPIGHASVVFALAESLPWQLSLKYSNSITELLNDSVAQLVRAQCGLYHFPTSTKTMEKVLWSGQQLASHVCWLSGGRSVVPSSEGIKQKESIVSKL